MFSAMGSVIILNILFIVFVCIVTCSKPTGSERLTIKHETSKKIANQSGSTGMTKVNRMKFEVMKVTESAFSYSKYIARRMRGKMKHYQNTCLKLIRDSQKQKLETLEGRVNVSDSGDHKINDCYETAKKKMHQQIEDLESANCSETDMAPINKFIDKIIGTTEHGSDIIDYLDDVIFHCCSRGCTRFYDCINSKVLRARDRIRIYRHEFKKLKETGIFVKNNGTYFQCYGKRAVRILQFEIDRIYTNATECILSHTPKS